MFRFSIDEETASRTNAKQLASNNITRDEDWEEGLRDTQADVPGERCFRAETLTPKSVDEAVSFVQSYFLTVPNRVWIGDQLYEVGEQEERGEGAGARRQ